MSQARITILSSKTQTEHNSGFKFAQRLAQHTDLLVEMRDYQDVVVSIKKGVVSCRYASDGKDIADTDLVYLRGKSHDTLRHTLAAFLQHNGVPVVNSESHQFQAVSKLEQNTFFALNGVPVPDSVYVGDKSNIRLAAQTLGHSFPLVVKSIHGRNGWDNMLVHNEDELTQAPIDEAIVQPFLPNKFDYRVIVAGDTILASYKRVRDVTQDDYKNNISQGGVREFVVLPDDLKQMAFKAANSIGRELTGLDILTNSETGESVVLEANFNFGTPDFNSPDEEGDYYKALANYFTGLSEQKPVR